MIAGDAEEVDEDDDPNADFTAQLVRVSAQITHLRERSINHRHVYTEQTASHTSHKSHNLQATHLSAISTSQGRFVTDRVCCIRKKNASGKRTVKEYGFKPIHEDTLWKMREKGLQDVMNEFGIPKSAAAAVMKNYQWDLSEARKQFRRADEMPGALSCVFMRFPCGFHVCFY